MSLLRSRLSHCRCAVALAPILSLLGGQTVTAVDIPPESSVGPPEIGSGDGLDASFYDASSSISSNGRADDFRNENDPTATFVSTLANYPVSGDTSSSGTSLRNFLGSVDASTLSGGRRRTITDSVFYFEGFISITKQLDAIGNNNTIDVGFVVGSDDGMRLRIGGVVVTEFATPRSFRFSGDFASFEDEGLYPIDLLYWERGGRTGVELGADVFKLHSYRELRRA